MLHARSLLRGEVGVAAGAVGGELLMWVLLGLHWCCGWAKALLIVGPAPLGACSLPCLRLWAVLRGCGWAVPLSRSSASPP